MTLLLSIKFNLLINSHSYKLFFDFSFGISPLLGMAIAVLMAMEGGGIVKLREVGLLAFIFVLNLSCSQFKPQLVGNITNQSSVGNTPSTILISLSPSNS